VDATIIWTFAVYLTAMLAIGLVGFGRTRDLSDYILGGRKMGRWVTAMSASASDMSGWLLMGLPGYAYVAGYEAGWIALGLFVGTWANWRTVSSRLRRFTAALDDSLTIPDYFERRFADTTRLLRVVSAIFILVFFTFYTSSGLVAGGKLFESVFGLDYQWAVAAGAGAVIAYTFLGGFFAVSWTDFFQALLMALALVLVPAIVINEAGGWGVVTARMEMTNPELLNPFSNANGSALGFIGITSLLGWGLGYFGQPHILARFNAIRSESELPGARRIAVTWVFITLTAALLAGFSGIAMVPGLEDADSEKIFIRLAMIVFHPVIAGICLAAILAAIMSTADSQLLVASSAVTEDVYRGLINRNATETQLVWIGRVAVIAIAAIAYVMAMDRDSKVLDLVAYAWAGFGAAFGPAIVLSLFWRNMSGAGALAGILVGGLTVIVWKQLTGGIFDLYEIVPGVLFSTLAIVVFSRLRPPDTGVTARFEEIVAR